MKISKRLKIVGDLVDENSRVIDVGCDHALLSIYLVNRNINLSVIASDVKKGPLVQAKENIRKHHMEDIIKIKEGNGLAPMEKDTDTVVITGMGGKTMLGIFKNEEQKLSQVKTIIISPNTDVILIRTFLIKHGFYLEKEVLLEEHNIIYSILKFHKGKVKYTAKELYFGPILLQKKDKLFRKYFEKELQRKQISLSFLPKKYFLKRYKLKQEINLLEKTIKEG